MPATIKEVMHPNPVTVPADATMAQAAHLMRDNNIGDVIVEKGHKLFGIITDRDIVVRGLAQDKDPSRTTVGDICTKDVATLRPDSSTEEAVAIIRKLSEALAYAHDARDVDGTPMHVVHRDLSPRNMMLGYDGETEEDIAQTIDHLKVTGADTYLLTVAYPIKGTTFHQRLGERVIPAPHWHDSNDRDSRYRGRPSDRFFRFAVMRVQEEVRLHRLLQDREIAPVQALKSLVRSRVARAGMMLTRNLNRY